MKEKDCGCGFGKRKIHRIVRRDKIVAFGKRKIHRIVRRDKIVAFGKKSIPKNKKTKSIPKNKKLYSKALREVKSKVKVWPSAYASGQVVQRYKRLGGTYGFGSKFYLPDSDNSMFLNPRIKKCLSIIYGDKVLTRFGKRITSKRKKVVNKISLKIKKLAKKLKIKLYTKKNGKKVFKSLKIIKKQIKLKQKK